MGIQALYAYCEGVGSCGYSGRVLIDRLRLPDETIWIQIPRFRRLICGKCSRRSISIFPDWRDHVAHGNGRRPLSETEYKGST